MSSTPATIFVIAAPSGAGKSTLVSLLIGRDPGMQLSISYTTRPPRPGEVNGQNYHFIDIAAFTAMRERGEFIEWAEVHGNCYGTACSGLEQQMSNGRDLVLEIDWQGAQQVRRHFPQSVGIFILPPSVEELERRLSARGQDSDAVIQGRVAAAVGEMRHVGEFDFVIINRDLAVALEDLMAAVHASRLRLHSQQARHPDVFRFLELG
ncbi:MAG: guanylate kinase [Georgfuchsia sp.]